MWSENKVPGVYQKEELIRAGPNLPTGIPAFVGFAPPQGNEGKLNFAVALTRKDDFKVEAEKLPQSSHANAPDYLDEAINGFFLNGGRRCYVIYAAALDLDKKGTIGVAPELEEKVIEALTALSNLSDIDLVALPDVALLPTTDAGDRAQRAVLDYCIRNTNWMAILDSLPGQDTAGVLQQRERISTGLLEPVDGALYYPWIKTAEKKLVPPCGHVAGIYARSDDRAGVSKAPANEEVKGAFDLERSIDGEAQAQLNPAGINCLRSFPGRGIRVWGARTLSSDPNWRYINVRRLFLTLHRWIDLNMRWTNFEPNTPALWVRIERELNSYLSGLWSAGALMGPSAEMAYYVKCDEETNSPEAEDAGQVVTEIGLAASAPAEYIVVRVVHHIGTDPR